MANKKINVDIIGYINFIIIKNLILDTFNKVTWQYREYRNKDNVKTCGDFEEKSLKEF